MKKLFFVIFILAMGLSSCSPREIETTPGKVNKEDYLIYSISDSQRMRRLFVYDPVNDIHTPILTDWEINGFCLSIDNRLAFSSERDGNSNIYIVDYPFTENVPLKITFDAATANYPITWNPDGRFLLFSSLQEDNNTLLLWDGKEITEIYDSQERLEDTNWSPGGLLVFTEFHKVVDPPGGYSSEIYLWDGNKISNVSQNPAGEDRFPTWSKDGKLAFLSEKGGEYDILVWDGISNFKGIPDFRTYKNVAPGMTNYLSIPTWTSSGSLAFPANGAWDEKMQIYEWDGETTTNISNNPFSDNGGQTWSSNGYWSFGTIYSDSPKLYVRDATNHTVLKTRGEYVPAWSQNGVLMFCVPDSPGWTLSIWNGKAVIEIVHGGDVVGKWNNGAAVYCTNG